MLRKIHFLRKSAQQLSSAQLFRTGSQLSSAQLSKSFSQLSSLSSAQFFPQLSSAQLSYFFQNLQLCYRAILTDNFAVASFVKSLELLSQNFHVLFDKNAKLCPFWRLLILREVYN